MYSEDLGRPHGSASPHRLSNDDTRFAMGRITGFQYLMVAAFLFLLGAFWLLQVRDHQENTELAARNSIRTVPLVAPRGKILDRDGRVIVDNRPSYRVLLSQENLRPEHLDAIAEGLHLDAEELRSRVRRYSIGPKYVPVPIKQGLTPAELTFVESHRDSQTFPEMELIQDQNRLYPHNDFAAHAIGYVGEVSEAELNTAEFAKYSQGEIVGKEGLERQYNDILMGQDGQRRVVVDSVGRERAVLDNKEATPGRPLQLTLDLDLQSVAELALDGKRGAVVALDPRNGEVLAMVSRPGFDPNLFTTRIRQSDWESLVNNPDKPLLNRAIQGTFHPGSTFKPIVTLAALETQTIDEAFSVRCGGVTEFYGTTFHCDAKHGLLDLHHAIVQSCDIYFYNVGYKLGIDKIAEYAQMVGIGKRTGIDLPNEAEGLMPDRKWKLRVQRDKWYEGETIPVAIGQGAVSVTPIQLASALGGLVSGGVWYQPHMVKAGGSLEPQRRADFNTQTIATIVSGMCGVVNEGGTGAGAQISGIEVCGKTGTAQRVSLALAKSGKAAGDSAKEDGWFMGFAPRQNPEIVVVALYEASSHGYLAAPIVRDVIKAYFDKKVRLSRTNEPQMALFARPRQ